MEIKNILVPHDGNQMSNKALMYAAEIAKPKEPEVILLHVIEEMQIPFMLLLGNDRVLIQRAKRSIFKRNRTELKQVCSRENKALLI